MLIKHFVGIFPSFHFWVDDRMTVRRSRSADHEVQLETDSQSYQEDEEQTPKLSQSSELQQIMTKLRPRYKEMEQIPHRDDGIPNPHLNHVDKRSYNVNLTSNLQLLLHEPPSNTPKQKLHRHFEMHQPKTLHASHLEEINHRYQRSLKQNSHNHTITIPPKIFDKKSQNPEALLTQQRSAWSFWNMEQKRRKSRISWACKNNAVPGHPDINYLANNRSLLSNILVDDKHELLYCYIPKVTHVLNYCILEVTLKLWR